MQKIGDITDTADGNGEFTDGSVSGNIQPTELMAAWFTTMQREVIAVLTEAGIQTDKANDAQLLAAIKFILAKGIEGSGYLLAKNNLSDLTDIATSRGHLGLGSAATSNSQDFVSSSRKVNNKQLNTDVTLNASDVGAVSKDGGDYNGTFRFGRVEILPNEQNATALFSKGGPGGTITSGAEYNWYNDKITTGITRGDSDRAWGYAIRLNGNDLLTIDTVGNTKALGNVISGGGIMGLQGDERRHFVINNADGSTRLYIYKDKGGDGIHFSNGVDGGGDFVMNKNGEFYSPSHLHAGGAALNVNGDVYGDVWGGWLSTQLLGRVTSSRRGPQQYINPGENGIWFGFEVPNGYFSGTRNHTDDGNAKFNEYYYRIQQIYIPAQGWVDTGTA